METPCPSEQEILSDIHCKISLLEQTISKLSQTSKSLSQNAAEVKSQIQTSISRQLETLRSREVWLLKQVELLHSVKEGELRGQIEALHQALGQLHNCLKCMDSADGLVYKTVADTLDKLKPVDVNDDLPSSPITFTVDAPSMRRAIHTFGRINQLNVNMAFMDGGSNVGGSNVHSTGGSSLPPQYEDYGDDQHHVFYKSLENTQDGQHKVTVNLPKLSPLPQDWLYMPPTGKSQLPESKTTPTCEFPPFKQRHLSEFMRTEKQTDHVEQWLHQIKGHAEMETDDFEIVAPSISTLPSPDTHSDIDSISIEILPETPCDTSSPSVVMATDDVTPPRDITYTETTETIQTFFNKIQNAPTSEWLIKKTILKATADVVNFHTMKYFRDASNDIKHWLLNKEEASTNAPMASCCASTDKTRTFDIENLDLMTCCRDTVTKGDTLTTVSKENAVTTEESNTITTENTSPAVTKEDVLSRTTKQWLLSNSHDEDADVDETPYLYNICKANEPCESLTDCVCGGKCAQEGVSGWLMDASNHGNQKEDTREGGVRITDEWVNKVEECKVVIDAQWLMGSNPMEISTVSVETSTAFVPPTFQHFATLNECGSDKWLNTDVNPSNSCHGANLFPPFEKVETPQSEWLVKPDKNLKPTTESTSEFFTGIPNLEGNWLKNTDENVNIAFEKLNFSDKGEKESSWLLNYEDYETDQIEFKRTNQNAGLKSSSNQDEALKWLLVSEPAKLSMSTRDVFNQSADKTWLLTTDEVAKVTTLAKEIELPESGEGLSKWLDKGVCVSEGVERGVGVDTGVKDKLHNLNSLLYQSQDLFD